MQSTNSTGPAGDDFVPAPDAASNGAPSSASASVGTPFDNAAALQPIHVEAGIGQTALILSLVAFLVIAGLLLLVRGGVRRSLIAGRATMDQANTAAWSWYVSLLLFAGLLIGGIVGHLFVLPSYIALTVAVLAVGVVLSMMLTTRAKRSV